MKPSCQLAERLPGARPGGASCESSAELNAVPSFDSMPRFETSSARAVPSASSSYINTVRVWKSEFARKKTHHRLDHTCEDTAVCGIQQTVSQYAKKVQVEGLNQLGC